MHNPTTIIHIHWSGPSTFDQTTSFTNDTDFGIYQIYGSHPVYGSDVLLYIGLSIGRFGGRIPNHEWWLEHHDDGRIRVYTGRLKGAETPSDAVWNRHIELAERLLIYAHQPAINKQSSLGGWEAELENVHVCNWGRRADLLPEVSGLRWTGKCNTISMSTYREVGEAVLTPENS